MKRILITAIIFLIFNEIHAQDIKTIPESWLQRAAVVNVKDHNNVGKLVDEFTDLSKNEILQKSKSQRKKEDYLGKPYIDFFKINLDQDYESEFVFLIGYNPPNTVLYVVDPQNNNYSVLLEEYIWMHNESPNIQFLGLQDNNKVFYIRRLLHRGSGAWLFTYQFFRFVDNRVLKVLEVADSANFSLDFEKLFQEMSTTNVSYNDSDIVVDISYALTPSYRTLKKLDLSEDPYEVNFISEKERAYFKWNNKLHIFQFKKTYGSKLSSEKIQAYMDLGNDETFLKAFNQNIKELSIKGNDYQKKVATYLLNKDQ